MKCHFSQVAGGGEEGGGVLEHRSRAPQRPGATGHVDGDDAGAGCRAGRDLLHLPDLGHGAGLVEAQQDEALGGVLGHIGEARSRRNDFDNVVGSGCGARRFFSTRNCMTSAWGIRKSGRSAPHGLARDRVDELQPAAGVGREVDDDVGAFGGRQGQRLVDRLRLAEQAHVGADQLHGAAHDLAGLLVDDDEAVYARAGDVDQAEAVGAGLDVQVRPHHAVDHGEGGQARQGGRDGAGHRHGAGAQDPLGEDLAGEAGPGRRCRS